MSSEMGYEEFLEWKMRKEREQMEKETQIIDVPVTEVPQEATIQKTAPTLKFENVGQYQDAITKAKNELIKLVQQGFMTEGTANRLLGEYEYSFFTQLITVRYE